MSSRRLVLTAVPCGLAPGSTRSPRRSARPRAGAGSRRRAGTFRGNCAGASSGRLEADGHRQRTIGQRLSVDLAVWIQTLQRSSLWRTALSIRFAISRSTRARCLRDHGVTDFPDPNAQGQLSLQMISAAGVDLHAPSFFTAAKSCVGVTRGAIPLAAVERAINGPH
jgi:hypothetical protein